MSRFPPEMYNSHAQAFAMDTMTSHLLAGTTLPARTGAYIAERVEVPVKQYMVGAISCARESSMEINKCSTGLSANKM